MASKQRAPYKSIGIVWNWFCTQGQQRDGGGGDEVLGRQAKDHAVSSGTVVHLYMMHYHPLEKLIWIGVHLESIIWKKHYT